MVQEITRRRAKQPAKEGSVNLRLQVRLTAVLLSLLVITSVSANAQRPRQQWVSPEQAYWDEYNRSTQRLYNNTQRVQAFADGAVNLGSRFVPRGQYLRYGYNATRRIIERNIVVPPLYGPQYQGRRRW